MDNGHGGDGQGREQHAPLSCALAQSHFFLGPVSARVPMVPSEYERGRSPGISGLANCQQRGAVSRPAERPAKGRVNWCDTRRDEGIKLAAAVSTSGAGQGQAACVRQSWKPGASVRDAGAYRGSTQRGKKQSSCPCARKAAADPDARVALDSTFRKDVVGKWGKPWMC